MCLFLVFVNRGISQAKDQEWLDELNRMEREAEQARKFFWCGDYETAEKQFSILADSVHPSVILYLEECAMCNLAQYDYDRAEHRLLQVDSLLNTYYSAEREKQALSVFGAEAEKIYRGDPYEQATAYLLLALLFLDKGDYDNALAACKSGILADSDATENVFDSDITLLHVLEAKCHQLRGQDEAFRSCRETAIKSVQITSEEVREDFSARLDLLALLKMSRKDRKSLGEKRKDEEIQAEIQKLTEKIDQKMASVNTMEILGPLYSGRFNVLVLVPRGRCVEKTRTGTDAEMVLFRKYENPCQCPDLNLDGQTLEETDCLPVAVDLEFQAMTRGGRRMDAILRGKAVSRTTTRAIGKSITDAGGNIGGVVGLGVALTGAIVQGTAGAMTAEADTRCWQSLPGKFQIYALDLSQGNHELSGSHYLYFQKTHGFQREIRLENEKDIAVVIIPPTPYELYFHQEILKLSKQDQTEIENASSILIPPPMGLDDIIRVNISDKEGKLETFAPDPKRIMRTIRVVLTENHISGSLVSHEQVVQERQSLSNQHDQALQCRFLEISRDGNKKTGSYRARFTFYLIDTKTGSVLAEETTEGITTDIESGSTKAFYTCLQEATQRFLQNKNMEACKTVLSAQK